MEKLLTSLYKTYTDIMTSNHFTELWKDYYTKPGNGHQSMTDWTGLSDEDQYPLIQKQCIHH